MIALISENLPELTRLCCKYGVRKLEIFGSAATGEFNPETSDIDFVIDFVEDGPGSVDRYLGFLESVEALFGRHVDLVFERKMKPRFRAIAGRSREVVFERESGTVAA
jgi:uncharacterized protein